MKLVKKMGLALGVAMAAVSMQPAFAVDAAMKVAVVNVQQVLQQSPRVAALSKKLESDFKARQTKIAGKQKALQDELEQFKKDSADAKKMTQKDRDAAQKKIASDRSELVKEVVAYQQDLGKEQNKVMQGILSDLNGIVSTIATGKGYNLVLDSQAVVFTADKANDLTKDVAKQFNEKG